MLFMFFSFFVSFLLVLVYLLIVEKSILSKEKFSSFECGFSSQSDSRLPFSMHFFLISVVFLIFDVEITMILPLPLMMSVINSGLWFIFNLGFILVLIVGAIYEWGEGCLDWSF